MTYKKMNRGWRGDSHRHSLSARGILNAPTRTVETAMLKAPLQNKSTTSRVQIAIIVPSTEYDKTITKKAFDERVRETRKFLSDTFGGDTSITAKGGYTEGGRLISEDVVLVETYSSPQEYTKNKKAIEEYIKKKQKEWAQFSIGYQFENDFHMYPKVN